MPSFPISVASTLVSRTASAIREAEKEGRLPGVARTNTGRRVGYGIAELNTMREIFGTRPWRAPSDPCAIISVQNFKGGVAKTTLSAHLAQFCAMKGYRTCLIDCDSQASSTTLFGYYPDLDLTEEDTIYPFLREKDRPDLRYALRKTNWDGLYLIPSNLRLYSAEYELAAEVSRGSPALLDRLSRGIQSIADEFDVIILDPPPALGTISLSVMRAANALLIPLPPTVMDFSSTASFLTMLGETMDVLKNNGMPVDLSWIKFVFSRVDEQKSMQKMIMGLIRKLYGDSVCRSIMRDSAEIDNATGRLMTVYELEQPATSRETHNRCVTQLNAVNTEIELEIRKMWPSHADRLVAEGLA
jgi:chromosome partitioning protein